MTLWKRKNYKDKKKWMCVPRAGVEKRFSTKEQESIWGDGSTVSGAAECGGGGDATECQNSEKDEFYWM